MNRERLIFATPFTAATCLSEPDIVKKNRCRFFESKDSSYQLFMNVIPWTNYDLIDELLKAQKVKSIKPEYAEQLDKLQTTFDVMTYDLKFMTTMYWHL
jgi:hypothetical protein